MLQAFLALVLLIFVFTPLIPVLKGLTTGNQAKKRIIFNLATFAFLFIGFAAFVFAMPSSAETAEVAAVASDGIAKGLGLIASALSMGLSGIGAGIAIAAGASSAIGATSEDPKMFAKSIIFVALGESIALFGFLVSILIIGEI